MPKATLTPCPSPSERGEQSKKTFSFQKQAEGESLQMEKEIFYREAASAAMVQIARDLRQRETSSEEYLWQAIRNRRLNNLKFRRQHPIANTAFVVDFLCYEARLVIELDGKIHQIQQQEDEYRQFAIESEGYKFLRFTNEQIKEDLESILFQIVELADRLIEQRKSPSPSGRGI